MNLYMRFWNLNSEIWGMQILKEEAWPFFFKRSMTRFLRGTTQIFEDELHQILRGLTADFQSIMAVDKSESTMAAL